MHTQGRGRIEHLASSFPVLQFSNNIFYCLLCGYKKWITYEPLDVCCRRVLAFRKAWQWKVTRETQAASVLQMVSLLLPSHQGSLLEQAHSNSGTNAYNACEDTTKRQTLTNSTGEDWHIYAHLNGWATAFTIYTTSVCNFFAPYVTMRYKVQLILFIHFPLWSVLNIERIGPQISSVGSYGKMTVVWVVCSSAWHRDMWGQARAQDLSWRIVLGKGSQSGWSDSKGEQRCLLSISASWGEKLQGESLGGKWHKYSESDQGPSRQQWIK